MISKVVILGFYVTVILCHADSVSRIICIPVANLVFPCFVSFVLLHYLIVASVVFLFSYKDLVRTRNFIKKFILMKANIQAISLKLQTLRSQAAMANAMKGE